MIGVGQFLANVRALAFGNVIALGVSLAATPILSRLYAPVEFGVFAMIMAGVTILTPLATLRLDAAVVLPKSEDTASAIFMVGMLSVSLFAVCAAAAAYLTPVEFLPSAIQAWLSEPVSLLLLATIVAGQGYCLMLSGWLLRQSRVQAISRVRVTETATEKILAIVLGIQASGVWGLLAGRLAGAGIATVLALRAMGSERPLMTRLADWRLSLQPYRRHAMYAPATVAIGEVSQWVPIVIAGSVFSPGVAGFFFLSRQLVAMPLNGVGLAIQRSLLRSSTENGTGGSFQGLCARVLLVTGPVTLLVSSVLFVLSELDVDRVLGDGWMGFTRVAAILSIGYGASFIHLCMSGTFDIFQAHRERLVVDVVLLFLRLGTFAVAPFLSWSVENTFWAFSGVTFAVYLMGVCQALRVARFEYRRMVGLVVRALVLPAMLSGTCLLIYFQEITLLGALVLLIGLIAIAVVVIAMGLRSESALRPGAS